ncbi:UNVERIFIED_CONTAM: SDR family oxidoreductase [Mycobacterium avium subsp. hominissuis]
MGKLDGTVALITGAARGMGAAHARAFAAEGARVVLADIRDTQGSIVAAELGSAGRYVHLDVTDREHWRDAVAVAEDCFGSVTVLVNNAAILRTGNIVDYKAELFRSDLEVNLIGAFNGIQATAPAMKRAGGGSIVNVGSVAAMTGFPRLPGYTASKWALRGLTKNAALDLGPHGIRVNAVHPGVVRTPMTAGHKEDQTQVALHRAADDVEISALVVFLASPQSGYITGADLVIDGGETAGRALPPMSTTPTV